MQNWENREGNLLIAVPLDQLFSDTNVSNHRLYGVVSSDLS